MLEIRQNFHIHSIHSCDGAAAALEDIIREMGLLGIEHYGLTDHLHTPYNLPDIESARHDFLANRPPPQFHFGVEVSCIATVECERVAMGDYTAWGDEPVYGFRDLAEFDGRMAIGLDDETAKRLGIEFVVGGVHWPLGLPRNREEAIANYLEQQLFLIAHPLVDVLAHPWDSIELAAGDWFRYRDAAHIDRSVYAAIPQAANDRLCEALLTHRKAAEINLSVLCNQPPPVREYLLKLLTNWKNHGVKFTIGDDLHAAHFSPERFSTVQQYLSERSFTDSDFVLPLKNLNLKS